MSDPSATARRTRRRLRWRWVAWRAGPVVVIFALVAARLALGPWIPLFRV